MSKQTFDFSEALRRIKEGKVVKRRSWRIAKLAIRCSDGRVVYYDGRIWYESLFNSDDILATDWEEVEE